jgi:mannose-6-phosphate isomerase
MSTSINSEDNPPPAGVHEIFGPIQHFAWGDTEFLPTFLQRVPDGQPWAEWWLGTHPRGPATLRNGQPLEQLSGSLAFMVKILAAAQPLSLQVHPDAEQAALGYARGEYADPRPKPEMIHALTDFEAFCGFRPVDDTHRLLTRHGLTELDSYLEAAGLRETTAAILTGRFDAAPTIAICTELSTDPECLPPIRWVAALDRLYPGDPSVIATLLLHHLQLRPGQALRLTAGTMHAYLRGAGLEIMGSSDNVLRCGLTSKPTDIDGALHILDATEVDNPTIGADAPQTLPELQVGLTRIPAGSSQLVATAHIAVATNGHAFFIEPGTEFFAEADTYLIGPHPQ